MVRIKRNVWQVLSVLSFFIALSLACATNKGLTGRVPSEYSEIVDVSGDKTSLYTKANLVFVDLFNNAESVIQFSDKEAGVIKGKYVSADIYVGAFGYTFTSIVEVSVKDNKYRIVMKFADVVMSRDLYGRRCNNPAVPTDDMLEALNQKWQELASEFKRKMNSNNSW